VHGLNIGKHKYIDFLNARLPARIPPLSEMDALLLRKHTANKYVFSDKALKSCGYYGKNVRPGRPCYAFKHLRPRRNKKIAPTKRMARPLKLAIISGTNMVLK
jgi:hypothetical protein